MDDWKDAVRIVRASTIDGQARDPAGPGRATAFDFAGTGSDRTWVGRVSMKPNAVTGGHHHGRHEVMVYLIAGRVELSWGPKLEHSAVIGPGDFAYFPPNVPHQERNLGTDATAEFLVVRSDNERIAVPL